MVPHVREVEVDIRGGELDVERRDLLAEEQKMADGEELRVHGARPLTNLIGGRDGHDEGHSPHERGIATGSLRGIATGSLRGRQVTEGHKLLGSTLMGGVI